MIEQAHQILLDAYAKHKELHSGCLDKQHKIYKNSDYYKNKEKYTDKQGNPVCQPIHQFEEDMEFTFQSMRHEYNQDLANSDNRILTYNSKKEFLNNSFLDGRHFYASNKKSVGYNCSIKEDYVKPLKNNMRITERIQVLITNAIAQCRLYDWLKENPPPEIENAVINKMVWNGTQKQLAELFVELENKGWIENIEKNTVEKTFTNTKSIRQYLKPTQTKSDKEKTYDILYSPKYEKIFDNINHCTKGS